MRSSVLLYGAIQSSPDPRDYPARMRLVAAPAPLPAAYRLARMPWTLEQQRASCVTAGMSCVSMKAETSEAGGASRADFEAWYDRLAVEQFGTQQDIGLAVRPALDSWRQKGPTVGGGYGEPEHFRIAAYYAISDLSAARRWIFERASPVLVVTRMAASWSDTTPVGQLVPIDFYGPATPDPWVTALHLWCLWGWDDRPTLGNLFRNSWGTSYGRNGNAYMTTEQWDRAFIEAWGVESVR